MLLAKHLEINQGRYDVFVIDIIIAAGIGYGIRALKGK
jgi:hypothetical protein